MILKKPKFWDYKKPDFLSYMLLPLTLPFIINNFFINLKKKSKKQNIKKIVIGNIYIGGTGKTPLSIKMYQILNNLKFKTGIIKKFYKNQSDEQELISNKALLYCSNQRKIALDKAIKDSLEIAIFDDGLQDSSIDYDLSFVCFNSDKWIGNGFLIPAGPLREKISSISKYDAIFLNGNKENISDLKLTIKKINRNIKIFETHYNPINIDKFNNKNRYIIFSGIGNPDSFKKMLIRNKFNIIKDIKFPDHYNYTQKDVDKIKLEAISLNAKILTTEKDYVKLDHNAKKDIQFLKIELVIKKENELINFIKSNL
jgi:tetraacyldisaccharide 4'-kinase